MLVATTPIDQLLRSRAATQLWYPSAIPTKLLVTGKDEPVFMSQAANRCNTKRDAEQFQIAACAYRGILGDGNTGLYREDGKATLVNRCLSAKPFFLPLMEKLHKGQTFRLGDTEFELVEPFGLHRWRCKLTNKNVSGTVCLPNLTILNAVKLHSLQKRKSSDISGGTDALHKRMPQTSA
jgi:hypothetical protein